MRFKVYLAPKAKFIGVSISEGRNKDRKQAIQTDNLPIDLQEVFLSSKSEAEIARG
jgi:hypothetical protein